MTHLNNSILSQQLIETVISQLAIDRGGPHGLQHWARVYSNGMYLAGTTGANHKVIQLFALFHDSKRISEGSDPDHGPRGASYAIDLHERFFKLGKKELDELVEACRCHTSVPDHDNNTVRTCFDADRLDLGRVGSRPDPRLLCTEEAKKSETISWAYQQSRSSILPENILTRYYQQTQLS